jgi:hypothetical protein
MSRVFVIQATRHQADVTPATAYGTVEFVLGPGDRTSLSPDLVLKKLVKGLERFDVEEDYVLWAGGDPLSLLLTGWALDNLGVGSFRYLRYEKADPRRATSAPFYVPVVVTLSAD